MGALSGEMRRALLAELSHIQLPDHVGQHEEVVITIVVPGDEDASIDASYVVRDTRPRYRYMYPHTNGSGRRVR